MKRTKRGLSLLLSLLLLISCFAVVPVQAQTEQQEVTGREILNFNSDWGYYRGDLAGAQAVAFDDSSFANVTIPHTMRLEQKHCNGGTSTYKGIGWYRRYFTLGEEYAGKQINIDFEGVMIDSDVYLNGELLYTRNGGYVGFSVDITDKVRLGETNLLAVRVSSYDNKDTPPGKPEANLDFHYYGGIYRDVTLRVTEAVAISDPLQADKTASGGVFVTYDNVSKTSADVKVKTHVVNAGSGSANVTVTSRILDKDGAVVAQGSTAPVSLSAKGDEQFSQQFTVASPNLWHPDHPYLYTLVSEVFVDGVKMDTVTNKIGIRTIRFDGQGFYINGEKLYLRGANRHQSYQNVGDAAPNSMQYRDALQMKDNGFNSVRATHYPQDPAFLAACDEVGLLVIECQPGWQNFTSGQVFYDRTLRDTREMIRRDRNHPSVILWETSLNETSYSRQWAQAATAAAHAEYPGDQIFTAADYGYQGDLYDVCYKVQDTQWSLDPSKWVDYDPNKPFLTREWGDYEGTSKALRKQGEATMNTQTNTRQRYLNGNGYSDWGGLDASDRIGGYFLWSWNDYSRGSNSQTLGSGTVDIDRYEKYCYYWFQSMQSARDPVYGPMVFIANTYSPDSSLSVNVYSNCDSVKLYQNGTLIKEITRAEAGQAVPNILNKGGSPIFTFALPQFVKGELKAEGILDGQVAETHVVKTPETAAKIQVEVRTQGITPLADGSDLIPVYLKAVDANGTVVPNFSGKVSVSVTGAGELVGKDMPRIKVEEQLLEGGIGLVYVRTLHTAGEVQVTAIVDGLQQGSAAVTTQEYTGSFVPDGTHTAWVGGVEKLEEAIVTYKNIAIGKPITASSEQTPNGNYARNAVDDDEGTRWCASGGAVPQWLQIDLQKVNAIAGFQLLWESSSYVYQYNIEVSHDAIRWEKVLDKTTINTPNGGVETQLLKTAGRYVRLNVTGLVGGWASLFEFRVIPDETVEEMDPGAIVPNEVIKSITASCESVSGRGTDKLRDGVTEIGSGWLADTKDLPQSVTIEFLKPQTLLGSRIFWEKDSSWYTYDLEVSTNGTDWVKALDNLVVGGQQLRPETFPTTFENIRFARVTIRDIVAGGSYNVGMAEWMLYGYSYATKEFDYASDINWLEARSDYTSVAKDKPAYSSSAISLNTPNGKRTFAKGLGADTNSHIIYDIKGKNYTAFSSYLGISTTASKQGGEAIFKIYLDGQLTYTSPVKMRDDNYEFVNLDLTGVEQIKLEAVWSGNTQNPEARYNTHVVWADAKFFFTNEARQQLRHAYDDELFLARKQTSYTRASWTPYAKALADAKAALTDTANDALDIAAILQSLTTAASGLKPLVKIKVACVGDSITYGLGANANQSYPAYLQELLGYEYDVRNFGVSSTTLLHNGNYPYVGTGAYTNSLDFEPDVVIIMLGTNDSKNINWGHKNEFLPDTLALIESYRSLSSKPKVYLATSAACYLEDESDIISRVITQEIVPLQKQAAKAAGVELIDIHAATQNLPHLFPDQVHPNAAGYALIAGVIADALTRPADVVTVTAPEVVTVWEDFEITLTSSQELGKFYLLNENGNPVSYTILGVTPGEQTQWTLRLNVGTVGVGRVLRIVDRASGSQLGSFTFDAQKKVVAQGILSVTTPGSAKKNELFQAVAVTSDDLIKGKFLNEKGGVIGSIRVARQFVDGTNISTYDLAIGTAGDRNITFIADLDRHNEWPYQQSFAIRID